MRGTLPHSVGARVSLTFPTCTCGLLCNLCPLLLAELRGSSRSGLEPALTGVLFAGLVLRITCTAHPITSAGLCSPRTPVAWGAMRGRTEAVSDMLLDACLRGLTATYRVLQESPVEPPWA